MEIQLAESKFELSSLSDQLMEAIQQKMALSQELEQWQVCQLDKYIMGAFHQHCLTSNVTEKPQSYWNGWQCHIAPTWHCRIWYNARISLTTICPTTCTRK